MDWWFVALVAAHCVFARECAAGAVEATFWNCWYGWIVAALSSFAAFGFLVMLAIHICRTGMDPQCVFIGMAIPFLFKRRLELLAPPR